MEAKSYGRALLANGLILAPLACGFVIEANDVDLYYRVVQEDDMLEWSTFWAFAVAAAIFPAVAIRFRRQGLMPAWFAIAMALLSAVIALEEISWGQRVIGYRPPVYFLEHNFQQELNVHNVFSTKLRMLALSGLIFGYGVVLPLLALNARVRRLGRTLGIFAPPAALIPAFFATFLLYSIYPWKFTGEWVELMLGLGFLFAALSGLTLVPAPATSAVAPARRLLGFWVLVLVLGAGSAAFSRSFYADRPELLENARAEVEALARDFRSDKVRTKCNLHKRVYSFKEKYRQEALLEGEFAALKAQGLPEERADFFLDPWNTPYWILDRCYSGRRVTYVYSFGPDRQRDSSTWRIRGDDVGAFVRRGRQLRTD